MKEPYCKYPYVHPERLVGMLTGLFVTHLENLSCFENLLRFIESLTYT